MKSIQLQRDLVDACYYGDCKKAVLCLRMGAKTDEPDERTYYPLHMACQEGHLTIVKLLLKSGAEFDLKDDCGKGESALFRAVGAGHTRITKELIKYGANVNLIRGSGKLGDTPLHVACAWGRFADAVALIKAGANPKKLDRERHSPLYHAVFNGHSRLAILLCKNGGFDPKTPKEMKSLAKMSKKNHVLMAQFKTRL